MKHEPRSAEVRVREPGGLAGTLRPGRSEDGRVVLALDDGRVARLPEEAIRRGGLGEGEGEVWTLDAAAEAALLEPTVERGVLPVAREEVVVGKRVVEGDRVRVRVETGERLERVEQVLGRDVVEVERVPVGRVVEAGEPTPEARREGEVTVVPVLAEELVVTRRLVLVEEVRIRRRREEHTQTHDVLVREQRVRVEREPPESPDGERSGR